MAFNRISLVHRGNDLQEPEGRRGAAGRKGDLGRQGNDGRQGNACPIVPPGPARKGLTLNIENLSAGNSRQDVFIGWVLGIGLVLGMLLLLLLLITGLVKGLFSWIG